MSPVTLLAGSRRSVERLEKCANCEKTTSPLMGAYLGSKLLCKTCIQNRKRKKNHA